MDVAALEEQVEYLEAELHAAKTTLQETRAATQGLVSQGDLRRVLALSRLGEMMHGAKRAACIRALAVARERASLRRLGRSYKSRVMASPKTLPPKSSESAPMGRRRTQASPAAVQRSDGRVRAA